VKRAVSWLALTLVLLTGATASARAQAPPPAAAAEADPWGFEEEEQVETWADILRPQALDIAFTSGLIAFALFSFSRRSKPLKYATLAITVAYLGVVKSTMISVTDIFRVVDSGRAVIAIPAGEMSVSTLSSAVASSFPDFKYSVAWYIFAGFTVISTVVWGRLYCGRICAFGAFTQWMDAILPKRLRVEPPLWLERRAGFVKFGLLAAVILYYTVSHETGIYRYVEPFWMFTRSATPLLWTMLGMLLVATIVVRNMYCRFLCPVGATLGLISQVSTVLPIKRWSECKTCKICERACEWGAIQGPTIIKTECVRCDDCERIYSDQKSCVHHLLAAKQERWQKQGIPLKVVT
jgi:NosR/NirI family nitrous oxide reductase transcriptional regulator